ncbi:MAG: folate family ECF transporter S component, partial [Clostridia bacterium]|nr:folate family ECF transporter S component [Clostridia bacterium]
MKKINTKKLCAIAMLLAITVVLSYVSGYLRIGTGIKLSISFISVYMAAALYGPLAGAFVGATADVISCIVNPVGALIWQLTLTELCYGFAFGLFFGRKKGEDGIKNAYVKVSVYSLLRFASDVFIKTKILSDVGYVPKEFGYAITLRMPGCVAMLVLTVLCLGIME